MRERKAAPHIEFDGFPEEENQRIKTPLTLSERIQKDGIQERKDSFHEGGRGPQRRNPEGERELPLCGS